MAKPKGAPTPAVAAPAAPVAAPDVAPTPDPAPVVAAAVASPVEAPVAAPPLSTDAPSDVDNAAPDVADPSVETPDAPPVVELAPAGGAFCPHCGSLLTPPNDFNPEFTVRPIKTTKAFLFGGAWVAAGAILSVPDRRASQLVALGHAEYVADAPPAADPHSQAVETATLPPARSKAARR